MHDRMEFDLNMMFNLDTLHSFWLEIIYLYPNHVRLVIYRY